MSYLSESFKKNYYKLLGLQESVVKLILEDDDRSKIKEILGLPDYYADWCHNLGPRGRYGFFIARTSKEMLERILERQYKAKGQTFDEFLQDEVNREDVLDALNTLVQGYGQIIMWLQSRGDTPNPDEPEWRMGQLTYNQAIGISNQWYEYISNLEREINAKYPLEEKGQVVIEYPDGMYWTFLGYEYCEEESKAMGHCGRSSLGANGAIYSLRKKRTKTTPRGEINYKESVVTADLDKNTREVVQIKGKRNNEVDPEYHKYVIDFLVNPAIGVNSINYSRGYDNGKNFTLSQMSDSDRKKAVSTLVKANKAEMFFGIIVKEYTSPKMYWTIKNLSSGNQLYSLLDEKLNSTFAFSFNPNNKSIFDFKGDLEKYYDKFFDIITDENVLGKDAWNKLTSEKFWNFLKQNPKLSLQLYKNNPEAKEVFKKLPSKELLAIFGGLTARPKAGQNTDNQENV